MSMKEFSMVSLIKLSVRDLSWPLPKVTLTRACARPRVNSADPCVNGKRPVSVVIVNDSTKNHDHQPRLFSLKQSSVIVSRKTVSKIYSRNFAHTLASATSEANFSIKLALSSACTVPRTTLSAVKTRATASSVKATWARSFSKGSS